MNHIRAWLSIVTFGLLAGCTDSIDCASNPLIDDQCPNYDEKAWFDNTEFKKGQCLALLTIESKDYYGSQFPAHRNYLSNFFYSTRDNRFVPSYGVFKACIDDVNRSLASDSMLSKMDDVLRCSISEGVPDADAMLLTGFWANSEIINHRKPMQAQVELLVWTTCEEFSN